jgi:hypothetical protein
MKEYPPTRLEAPDDNCYVLLSDGEESEESDVEEGTTQCLPPLKEGEERMMGQEDLEYREQTLWEELLIDSPVETTKELCSQISPLFELLPTGMNELNQIFTLLPSWQDEDDELTLIKNAICSPTTTIIPERLDWKLHQYRLDGQTGLLSHLPDGGRLSICIPQKEEIRNRLIKLFHTSTSLSAHASARTTTGLVQRYFHWKGMGRHITSWCEGCPVCVKVKRHHGKIPGHLTSQETPLLPFKRLHLDTSRCLPSSPIGYRHVLVAVDVFTKYIYIYSPVKNDGSVRSHRWTNDDLYQIWGSYFNGYGPRRRIL